MHYEIQSRLIKLLVGPNHKLFFGGFIESQNISRFLCQIVYCKFAMSLRKKLGFTVQRMPTLLILRQEELSECSTLVSNDLWWKGPQFLTLDSGNWPCNLFVRKKTRFRMK